MKELKRGLGLFGTTIIGVGTIVGAGIYVLLGKAVGLTGPSAWLSFIIAAILALFTGLSYAELSSMFAKDASEYYYVKKAFKSKALAFLTGWICILEGILGSAAVAIGFSGYVNYMFGTPVLITAFIIVILLSLINYIGIRKSAFTETIFTFAALLGLLIIIYAGSQNFGSVNYLETLNGFKGIFKASALIFFAYIGFQTIVRLSEETREPKKTVPKAILLSLLISTLLYIGVAIAGVSILSTEELSASSAPLSDIILTGLGTNISMIVAILAIFATLSTVLALLITTSRLMYGMAKEHSLPESIRKINPITKTPGVAVLLTGLGALFFVMFRDIELIASMVNFTVFLAFILVNLSLIFLRISYPNVKRPFKVPINIRNVPLLAIFSIIICSIFLLQFSIEVLIGTSILVIFGALIYEVISKEKNLEKGIIDPYRLASLIMSLVIFIIGAFILTGGFLSSQFWWTGILWIMLGLSLFWYTYSIIFRE